MIKQILIFVGVTLLVVIVILIAVGPTVWQHVVDQRERELHADDIQSIPVWVHELAPREEILKASELIEYRGEPRVIVRSQGGTLLWDNIGDLSVPIRQMADDGPYCVELLSPLDNYHLGEGNELIDKAARMGLVIGCGSSTLVKAESCESIELAGIIGHPFTATATDTEEDPRTHAKDSFSYKISRDGSGRLYTYRNGDSNQEGEGGEQFKIEDPVHLTQTWWGDGPTEATIWHYQEGHPRIRLLGIKYLGKERMEGFDVDGYKMSCSLAAGDSGVTYELWSSSVLGSYIDFTTDFNNSDLKRENSHLTNIHLGSEGTELFKPPPGLKFKTVGP